jgi:hypothetical protein
MLLPRRVSLRQLLQRMMSGLLTPTTAAAILFGLAVLIAVIAAVLPRSPGRRRDALKALEILMRRSRT